VRVGTIHVAKGGGESEGGVWVPCMDSLDSNSYVESYFTRKLFLWV
jgi:hypothetical protein